MLVCLWRVSLVYNISFRFLSDMLLNILSCLTILLFEHYCFRSEKVFQIFVSMEAPNWVVLKINLDSRYLFVICLFMYLFLYCLFHVWVKYNYKSKLMKVYIWVHYLVLVWFHCFCQFFFIYRHIFHPFYIFS